MDFGLMIHKHGYKFNVWDYKKISLSLGINHHQCGSPEQRTESSDEYNHFAYLKPIDESNIAIEFNSIITIDGSNV